MSENPILTRETLLIRLRNSEDQASWKEFVDLYTPLIYRYCQKREITHSDAADISQNVMRKVAGALQNFQYDPEKGKFKAWLFTTVRHSIIDFYRLKARQPIAESTARLIQLMDCSPNQNECDTWEQDYQRQMLAWAMEKIKPEFSQRIWGVFENTALKGQRSVDVAKEVGMSENAIAVAKHRVSKRLKEKIEGVDSERWEQEMVSLNQES